MSNKSFKATKKPVTIEAIKLTEKNIYDVTFFIEGKEPELITKQAAGRWEDYKNSVIENGLKIMIFLNMFQEVVKREVMQKK